MVNSGGEKRFRRAQGFITRLGERGIWFAPIRHHSPACARAVRSLIAEIAPAVVLIEGPAEYDRLLPVLTDAETRPPVAILSLRPSPEGPVSTFFPLADFSPEWVGLRAAVAHGAQVGFIDRPWTDDSGDQAAWGLATERYYAQSQALTALARQEHCRDHDELWEHLFELRHSTWANLFGDIFAWSALARLDYEPEVLQAEGSLAREAVMVAYIEQWRARLSGPLVVITGAFHTLALVETLAVRLLQENAPEAPALPPVDITVPNRPAWLIPYDLTRLDALTGYGAGIRAPGFYQRQWETGDDDVVASCLADIARSVNRAGTTDRLSLAEVIEATLQAHRLAELRGHPYPGRTDLLDACTSCFIRGDLAPAVRDGIAEVCGGVRLGTVPADNPAPPIVAEAKDRARQLRLVIDDSGKRNVVLDIRRSAVARRRSQFFWLMSYLDSGFAKRLAGPDYIAGQGLGRLREEWEYAWTPLVDAQLIGLVPQGATLHEVARQRLRAQEAETPTRSSQVVAGVVAQAILIGLDDEVTRLTGELNRMIGQDSDLDSVLGAIRQLLGLWRARELLAIPQPETLLDLADRGLPQLAYLLEKSADVKAEAEPGVVAALIGAYDLTRNLAEAKNAVVLHDALNRLRTGENTAPGVLGASLALGVTAGEVGDEDLGRQVRLAFAPGADSARALRFFDGVMQAAPDLFLHTPELFDAVSQAVSSLDGATFLELLPDLRRSLGRLRPFETAEVAERVARNTGVSAAGLATTHALIGGDDLRLGRLVEQALLASLAQDCLVFPGQVAR